MKKRLTRIAPLKLGIILAVFYALFSLLVVPAFMLIGFVGAAAGRNSVLPAIFMGIGAVFLPLLYGVLGFVFGVVSAFVYNLVAKWTGGIELTLEDVEPPSLPAV